MEVRIIYRFRINTPHDKPLADFRFEKTPPTSWLAKWRSGYDRSNNRYTHADPWTEDVPLISLLQDSRGIITDFIDIQGLTFASFRALEIMEHHHVNMQVFDCAVQLKKNQPPSVGSHKLYRLLDKGQVVDLERSEIQYHSITNNPRRYRNIVPTESFVNSDAFMMRDSTFATLIFVKEALKQAMEQAGLLGHAFTPIDEVEYWPLNVLKSASQEKASKTTEFQAQARNDDHASSKSISATELTEHDQHEIEDSQRIALKELRLTSAADPKTIVQAIVQVIDSLVEESLSDEDVMNCAVGYGCLYGEQICRHHNWQWRMVHYPKESDPSLAVVTFDYAYVVHPMALVYDILANDKTNNLMLLFNLLSAEDTLPAGRQQDGFVVLG